MGLGLSPEIDGPVIIDTSPPDGIDLPAALPINEFEDGGVLTRWLSRCPVEYTGRRIGMLLARALSDPAFADDAAPLMDGMVLLDERFIVRDRAPDFMPAIDVRAMAEGQDSVHALFAAVLDNDRERLVRVCHGAVGEGVTVHLFIDGTSVPHGGYARLAPGRHALVMQTCSGLTERPWQWPERHVAVRFDETTPDAINAVAEWRRGRWQETWDGANADESELVSAVDIDPDSVIGTPGFIRAGRSRTGMWWLLDADGQPFYYRGMCSVNHRGGVGGRRKGDPPLSPERVRHWLRTIRSWGFNGLGSWTTPEFFEQGLYYTEIIETFYEGPYVQGGQYRYGVVPDVYDPDWAARIDRKCRMLCAPLAECRGLVGYFLDNERSFLLSQRPEGVVDPVMRVGEMTERRRVVVEAEPIQNPEKLGLLQLALSLPDSRPTARVAWDFVAERHGSGLEGVSKAWDVPIPSRLAVNEMTINGERLVSDAYLDDEREFVRRFVRRYFEIGTSAIRRYDPNHFIIGLRWVGVPDETILSEEVQCCDIVSMNRYRVHIAEAFDMAYRRTGKPILIGECEPTNDSFRWARDPIEPPGGYEDDVARCGTRTYETMNRVFEHPGIVGYTFYAWKNASLHPDYVRPVVWSNHRATAIRAARERSSSVKDWPQLNGQIFVVLTGAPRDIQSFGFVCRDGVWNDRVYGHCLRGRASSIERTPTGIRIEMVYRVSQGPFVLTPGGGSCRIEMERVSATEMEGPFRGVFDDVESSGTARAYVHRPLPDLTV